MQIEQRGLMKMFDLGERVGSTGWRSRVSLPRISEGYVTKFALHKAQKVITSGKLTFDERVVLHRVDGSMVVQRNTALERLSTLDVMGVNQKLPPLPFCCNPQV